jgi:hypothetical protein
MNDQRRRVGTLDYDPQAAERLHRGKAVLAREKTSDNAGTGREGGQNYGTVGNALVSRHFQFTVKGFRPLNGPIHVVK